MSRARRTVRPWRAAISLDAVRRRVQQELIRRTGIRRDETQRRHTDGLRGLRDAGLLREGNQRETEERWKHPRQASWFWGTRKLRRHPEPPNTPSEGFVDLSPVFVRL